MFWIPVFQEFIQSVTQQFTEQSVDFHSSRFGSAPESYDAGGLTSGVSVGLEVANVR